MSYPIYYVEANDTLPHLFDTFDGGTGASITMTGLAVGDILIYKDGSVTQRSSTSGFTLLDTDGIDFDTITGIHGFSIDLSDNTDAGFYAVGSWYHVVISTITVDAQTVSFVAFAFRIVSATRGMAGTALPDAAADAAGGLPISDAGGLDLDAMNTNINDIETDTADMQPKLGTITDLGSGATIGANLVDIEAQTDDIGAAGAGLTAIPWNAAWDAEVESEVTDGLNAYDPPTRAELTSDINSVLAQLPSDAPVEGTADSGTTLTMVDAARTEADTDYWKGSFILFTSGTISGQARLITAFTPGTDTITFTPATTQAVGTNTYRIIPAAQIEEVLVLTGHTPQTGDNYTRLGAPAGASVSADIATIDGIVDNILVDTAEIGSAGAGLTEAGGTGDQLTAIPWNTSWDAEVESEVTDGLNAYDPPTRAELTTDINSVLAQLPSDVPIEGTADSGTTLTMVDAARTEADTDYWAGSWILFTSGTISGQARLITAFTPATDTITFTPATTQAVTTNTYRIIPAAYIEEVLTLTGHTAQTGDNYARLGAPSGASVSADIAENQTDLNTIIADTNELQTDWVDGGRLDLLIDSILADTNELQTDDVPGLIAALNNLSAAQVNAEVVDALATDTYAEPTGVPGATVTLATKLGYLYMALRNQVTVTSTKKTFYDDAGAAEWEKDLSDDATTYTETEANAI